MARSIEYKEVFVGRTAEIPEGARKIIQVDKLSVGVFHHKDKWFALHNSCLHRGGPICEGKLDDDTLTCPWHGYQYNVTNGELLLDTHTRLPSYPVEIRAGEVWLRIPILVRDEFEFSLKGFGTPSEAAEDEAQLAPNEFRADQLQPGNILLVTVDDEPVAVYNLDGELHATHDTCTHAGGPLSEGTLDGSNIICPWHDSCFDVTNGNVTCGPATEAVRTYRVVIEGDIGRVS